MLLDPFALKRPTRKVWHRTLTDPAHPDTPVSLSLRKADTIDLARVAGELARMRELYLTGSEDMPPGPFPLVGGEMVPVSEELFAQACTVAVMQAAPEESKQERVWQPEQLVAIAFAMPDLWSGVLRLVNEINREKGAALGNSATPPTE